MTTMMTTMRKWQGEYFTLVKRIEDPVIDVTGKVAESVARYVPPRPSVLAPLPTTKDLVENQLTFRKRFVEEQAAFVRRVVKAMDPVLVKLEHSPAVKPVAKATPKRASRTTSRTGPRAVSHTAA